MIFIYVYFYMIYLSFFFSFFFEILLFCVFFFTILNIVPRFFSYSYYFFTKKSKHIKKNIK